VTLIGVYGIFFPMHFVGLAGLPRRFYTNTAFPYFVDVQIIYVLMTVFSIITGLVQLLLLFNFFRSKIYIAKASENPWKATTLEWTTPVERLHGNWPGELPIVYRWPYDYSKLNKDGDDYVIAGQDFIPQNIPVQENEEEMAE